MAIINFPGITRLDLPADRVLEGAIGKLKGVVVMGYTEDGAEYFVSSYADGSQAVWLAERMKHRLMKIVDDMTGGE